MILSFFAVALAQDIPDRLALTLEEGTSIEDLVSHSDEEWFAWLEGASSEVRLLDGQTWETTAVAVCTDHGDAAAGLAFYEDPESLELAVYVGCGDGTVERVTLEDRSPSLDDSGSITVASQPVLGLVADAEGLVIAVEPEDETGVDLHAFELGSDADTASDPTVAFATPTRDGFEAMGLTTTMVLVAHGGQYVTEVTRSSGAAISADTIGVSRDWVDITSDGSSEVYLADTDGVVGSYSTGQNEVTSLLGSAQDLEHLSALVLQPDGDAPYLAVAESEDDALVLFSFTGTTVSTEEMATLAGADSVHRLAVVDDVLGAGTSDGRVLLFTDDPWVEITEASSEALVSGDSGSVTFETDLGGTWSLRLGSVSGTELDSGSVEDGGSATASFAVDGDLAEGTNRLYVLVEEGHDAVDVLVDDPPETVALTEDDLLFGDQEVILQFAALEADDIASYDVYFSTSVFSAEEWSSGGPSFSEGDLSSPVLGTEDDDGIVTITLSPLTNDTLYYVGVRATDSSGQEGPMSTVYEAMPEPIAGAAELAGEQGGFIACSSVNRGGGGLLLLGLGLLGLARRRAPAVLVAVLALSGLSTPAHALPPLLDLGVEEDARKSESITVEVGPAWFEDETLNEVYGSAGVRSLNLSRERQWYRLLGLGVSLGLMSEDGEQLGVSSGSSSGQIVKLKVVPIRAGGTFWLDLFDGQPVVPMVTLGLDYLLWWETTSFDSTDPFSSERVGGGKPAWDWGVGCDVLLDRFEPGRAQDALTRWGIHDTYLTVRYEQLRLLPGLAINSQGLDFGYSGVSVGLRLDR